MIIKQASIHDSLEWDKFVSTCEPSHFFFYSSYLNHNIKNIHDLSLIAIDDHTIVSVFPLASERTNPKIITSHPRLSFSQPLFSTALKLDQRIQILDSYLSYIRSNYSFESLSIKLIPQIYFSAPDHTLQYWLSNLSAERSFYALSNISTRSSLHISPRRRRSIQKALKNNITVNVVSSLTAEQWSVVHHGLKSRHNVSPVHSIAQINYLKRLFPSNLHLLVANHCCDPCGILVLFITRSVMHVQYSVASDIGLRFSALDSLYNQAIKSFLDSSASFFSMGISTNADSKVNTGLYSFKEGFSKSSILHETYTIRL